MKTPLKPPTGVVVPDKKLAGTLTLLQESTQPPGFDMERTKLMNFKSNRLGHRAPFNRFHLKFGGCVSCFNLPPVPSRCTLRWCHSDGCSPREFQVWSLKMGICMTNEPTANETKGHEGVKIHLSFLLTIIMITVYYCKNSIINAALWPTLVSCRFDCFWPMKWEV